MRLLILLLLATVSIAGTTHASAKDIHNEKSLYRNIVVREDFTRRCLVFAVKRGDRNQTCMDLRDPNKLVFAYVRMTLGGLLANPDPERVLVIGLGGGSIPLTLTQLFPDALIDIVEIDEAVVRVAGDYFGFEQTDKMRVHVSDARVFVKRAILKKKQYDFIVLDAFTGDYIPEHLLTVEFLQEAKTILDPDGVLVANTFSTSLLYDHESETYKAVFGDFLNFKMPGISGNRVIIAKADGLPDEDTVIERARFFAPKLERFGVKFLDFPGYLSRDEDWNHNQRPLTDQYSPANLLQGERY